MYMKILNHKQTLEKKQGKVKTEEKTLYWVMKRKWEKIVRGCG